VIIKYINKGKNIQNRRIFIESFLVMFINYVLGGSIVCETQDLSKIIIITCLLFLKYIIRKIIQILRSKTYYIIH